MKRRPDGFNDYEADLERHWKVPKVPMNIKHSSPGDDQ